MKTKAILDLITGIMLGIFTASIATAKTILEQERRQRRLDQAFRGLAQD